MRFQLRCVHDIRINLNVIYASSVLMFVRFTHQGISFNLEGCPQAIADGGWGQPEKELQTRWPLLTYGEGEGEVLSLINHSFGDGPQVQSVHHYMYTFSASPHFIFSRRNRISERETKKQTHPPSSSLFVLYLRDCAPVLGLWRFSPFWRLSAIAEAVCP